jgi:hypothetical protein
VGFSVGRQAGGYVVHHTRNTAPTNLRAGGEETDAMKITGHQPSHVFRHYDLGNVEVLPERLARALPAAHHRPPAGCLERRW